MTEHQNIGFSFMKFIFFMVVGVSLSNIHLILSIVVLTIGGIYTIRKWYIMEKRHKYYKNDKRTHNP